MTAVVGTLDQLRRSTDAVHREHVSSASRVWRLPRERYESSQFDHRPLRGRGPRIARPAHHSRPFESSRLAGGSGAMRRWVESLELCSGCTGPSWSRTGTPAARALVALSDAAVRVPRRSRRRGVPPGNRAAMTGARTVVAAALGDRGTRMPRCGCARDVPTADRAAMRHVCCLSLRCRACPAALRILSRCGKAAQVTTHRLVN